MSIIANKTTFIPASGGEVTLWSGFGKILAFIISTEQTAGVDHVIFYDGLSSSADILLDIRCPMTHPWSVFFTPNRALSFSAGLTIDPGDCNVHVTLLAK